jgi:prepilin-type N-terminal cleavage/methylation domain-containing protein
MRRGGFTLVELLVVIGIIALLAAIVVPVYTRAMEQGRQADCISHIHAVAIALRAYHEDYRAYPPPPFFNEAAGRWDGGFGALWEGNYITSHVGLRCRDDTESGSHPERTYSSYNQWYNYLGYDNNGNPIQTLADAKNLYAPGGTPLLDERGRALWKLDADPANPGTYTSAFPGLINPLAPGETIFTHCGWHRNFYGGEQARDIAGRLEGNVQRILVSSYSTGNKWQFQPAE